jgi:hypothetical protein
MGGFGSGRFGRRSEHVFSNEVLRLALSDLAKASVFASLDRAVAVVVGAEVEIVADINGSDHVRVHLGTRTGNEPRHWPRAGRQVMPEHWIDVDSCFIELGLQRQPFGGYRLWFICPGYCGRRCSVLYRPHDTTARAFACRACCNVRYKSQRLGKSYRLESRAESIFARLIRAEGELLRPKGMHLRTFDRLSRSAEDLIARSRALPPACL